MRKKLTSLLLAGLLLTVMILSMVPAMATETSVAPQTPDTESSNLLMAPRADHLITYYRTLNGVYQYRIWNATWGYWVNDWTNL